MLGVRIYGVGFGSGVQGLEFSLGGPFMRNLRPILICSLSAHAQDGIHATKSCLLFGGLQDVIFTLWT